MVHRTNLIGLHLKSINDISQRLQKYQLKNQAKLNITFQQVLSLLFQIPSITNCLREGRFVSKVGLSNLPPINRTQWVAYGHQNWFDSYRGPLAGKSSEYIIEWHGYFFYSAKNMLDYKPPPTKKIVSLQFIAQMQFVWQKILRLWKIFYTCVLNLY